MSGSHEISYRNNGIIKTGDFFIKKMVEIRLKILNKNTSPNYNYLKK